MTVSGSTVNRLPHPPTPEINSGMNGSVSAARWPRLHEAGYYGLAGEVVQTIAPETEADPAAVLVQFLAEFGNAVGRSPHAQAGGAEHPARLWPVVAGETSKARKGSSLRYVKQVMAKADSDWSERCVASGLSSGEGLIGRAAKTTDPRSRLMVEEGEFGRLLTAAGREGNILSSVLRDAYDGLPLSSMTKDPLHAPAAHISVIGHITVEELRYLLTGLQAANGFANRFLFVLARRTQLLPRGGNLDDREIASLAAKVETALEDGGKRQIITRSEAAEEQWAVLYRQLAADAPGGLLGGLVSRAEAQALRLSVVYALLDGTRHVEPVHLAAAAAVWCYCRESAAHLFGDRLGNVLAERILAIVRGATGKVLSLTEISALLARHATAKQISDAIDVLVERGLLYRLSRPTRGRSRSLVGAIDA
ncbi:MAG: DUF3987 domain-containing protein [Acidimicrobiales bacterium]|jgi:hypothetical protein